jgi:hypothetical protein
VLLGWDALRQSPPGLFALAATNNTPERWPRPDELLPRLQTWLAYADTLIGWPFLLVAGLIGIGGLLMRQRVNALDKLLAGYTLLYLLAHWLLPFNLYDRYLLPILPLVVVLLARVVILSSQFTVHSHSEIQKRLDALQPETSNLKPIWLRRIAVVALCLTLLPGAWNAAQLQVAVGGDRGQLAGMDDLAAWLEAKPLGTILYDRWLGWGLEYYRGSWSDKRMVYYPTPELLAAGAAAQPDPAPRYFPMPLEAPADDWLQPLREAGFTVSLVYSSPRFVVYELIPPG